MRNHNFLIKLRLVSALLLVAFGGGGSLLVYKLFLSAYPVWGCIVSVASFCGATASVILLFGALFRAKAVPGGVCFVSGSFVSKLVKNNDDLCPVFYRAVSTILSVIGYVVPTVLFVGMVSFSLMALNYYLGISYYLSVGALLSLIALVVARRDSRVVKMAWAIGSVVIFLLCLVGLGAMTWAVWADIRWMIIVHVAIFLVVSTSCGTVVYAALYWETFSKTFVGRVLSPLKRRSCVPVSVCVVDKT